MPRVGSSELNRPSPSTDLDGLYLYFYPRFDALSLPRSVAEIAVSSEEIDFLIRWVSDLYGKHKNWCDRDWPEDRGNGIWASDREMFGAIFLILAAEKCREDSGEDSVWPSVAAAFSGDKVSFSYLFGGGRQPSETCKAAVSAAVRRLGLRNLIDRYGTQKYFDTVKLQFGFTRKGALAQLPDWLMDIGIPMAIRILCGDEQEYVDLRSESFSQMWKALRDFNRGRSSETYTRAILLDSPWVKSYWVDQVLEAAAYTSTRVISIAAGQDLRSMDGQTICQPILKWDAGSKPRIQLRLDEEHIRDLVVGSEISSIDFVVDNVRVGRWLAQEDGCWSGPRIVPCEPGTSNSRPNLRPKVLSVTSDGIQVAEIDLSSVGLDEPLLLFELRGGTSIDPSSALDANRDYALVCDSDLKAIGVNQPLSLSSRNVYRVPVPVPEQLQVHCDGAVFWEPRIRSRIVHPMPRPVLRTFNQSPVDIGSRAELLVNGVPDETTKVSLFVGHRSYTTEKVADGWRTKDPIEITLDLALGLEPVRAMVDYAGRSRATSLQMA